jgi:hypothetical protein
MKSMREVTVPNSLVLDLIQRPQAESNPHLTTFDSSQQHGQNHWLEPCTLVEKKDPDLDGYLFDDFCLFLSN